VSFALNQVSRHREIVRHRLTEPESHRGKTVTKPRVLNPLGMLLSEKQIPQVIERFESGGKRKEALERTVMRPRQVRYQAALRPDI
jgi:hypothetical protein